MSEAQQPDIKQLMRDAITAAREGDSERARTLFEQIVELDPNNEKAWFWLASLVETDEERRVCLGNVVFINPNNERAQRLLSKLEADQEAEKAKAAEFIPGVSRRTLFIGVGIVAFLLVCICGAIVLVVSSSQQAQANAQATLHAGQTAGAAPFITQTAYAGLTQTAVLAIASPTPIGPTLPPTWTQLPTATEALDVTATPFATAVGNALFSGSVLAASGQDPSGQGRVPIVQIPLDGSPPRTLYEGRAGAPSLSPTGQLAVYTRFSSGTGEQAIEIAWLDGAQQPRLLSQILGGRILARQDDASFSPDGSTIAFSAREPGSLNSDLYVFSLTAAGILGGAGGEVPEEIAEQALRRLTDGNLDSSAPAWSDATHLVFVADARPGGGQVDLRIVTFRPDSAATFQDVTHDGNVLIEDNPSWSPDGTRIAYQAYTPDNPDDVDIYLMFADGTGDPLKVVDSDGTDVRPRWSPDSQYLVYSSNRSGGNWEIYIVDVINYANYQVTLNNVYDVANDWAP